MKNSLVSYKGRAKINLAIDVVGKRGDGYHLVDMIMTSLRLSDTIKLQLRDDEQIVIDCEELKNLPKEKNIVYKACKLVQKNYNVYKGVDISIEKQIPIAAGLAGGSADAAATLKALNEVYDLGLDDGELRDLGLSLGADVPFSILEGTARARGVGEKLDPLPHLEGLEVLLVKPKIEVSTEEIYKQIDKVNIEKRPNLDLIIKSIKSKKLEELSSGCYNVLEIETTRLYPQIARIKESLLETQPLLCLMSGSGPTVFALYTSKEKAKSAYNVSREKFKDCEVILTQTYI